jgi:hypothetical protein
MAQVRRRKLASWSKLIEERADVGKAPELGSSDDENPV